MISTRRHLTGQFAELDVVGFTILHDWVRRLSLSDRAAVVLMVQAFLNYLLGRGEAAPAVAGKQK